MLYLPSNALKRIRQFFFFKKLIKIYTAMLMPKYIKSASFRVLAKVNAFDFGAA
jgi:hypothetical protein